MAVTTTRFESKVEENRERCRFTLSENALNDAAAYVNPNVTLRNGKPVMAPKVDFESAPPYKI
jgi:hypothetical protein